MSWVSNTVLPNETVLVAGSGFAEDCTVLTLQPHAPGRGVEEALLPVLAPVTSVSRSALTAVLPATTPLAVFDVSVRCGGTRGIADQQQRISNAVRINAPRIFWAQGDCGDTATVGGTLRVFGEALRVAEGGTTGSAMGSNPVVAPPTLRLTSPDGTNVTLVAEDLADSHRSGNHALFRLPLTLREGEFAVAVSNALQPSLFTPMQVFLAPGMSHVSTVKVTMW